MPETTPLNTPSAFEPVITPLAAGDGATFELITLSPGDTPANVLFWLPAMGVPAKHYLPLAEGLVLRGFGVALHEWRGIGSSDRRAGHHANWGYRELLEYDLAASMAATRARWPQAKIWLGGHSLGGQLACLYASTHAADIQGIALVASGAPYWRSYRAGRLFVLGFLMAPLVTRLFGYLPGRRLRFAGNEARGVIDDWARSGVSGRYVVKGMSVHFDEKLAELELPVLALRMHDDWLGPDGSLQWLLGKMPHTRQRALVIDRDDMHGHAADHFTWMKHPDGVLSRLVDWLGRYACV